MRKLQLGFLLLLFPIVLFSQSKTSLHTKSNKAVKLYEESTDLMAHRKFDEAVFALQKAIKVDENFAEAHYRLGFIYVMNNRLNLAKPHFEKTVAIMPNEKSIRDAYLSLAEIYFQEEKYKKAADAADKFLKLQPGSKGYIAKAEKIKASALFAIEAIKNPLDFEPTALSEVLNSFQRQYFPVLTGDQQTLIFTANAGKNKDEDIYMSTKLNGEWQRPEPISKNLNTEFNEGTCTISADGRIMIFTSCDGRESYGRCDLYETHRKGNEWSEPVNLGAMVNSPFWESQPALSGDGRTLYFISDRRGGMGGKDIYVSNKNSSGEWTQAKSVGQPINTPFDEISPFIHGNNKTLFFASEGHPGMGGFDLFYSNLGEEGWGKPVNLGYPVNTKDDQVSLFVTADGRKGFYTFETFDDDLGKGTSILAEFDMPDKIEPFLKSNFVKGEVFDADTHEKLEASIDLFNIKTEELISSVTSDPTNGEYMILLTEGSEYALYVRKEGYLFKSLSFDYREAKNPEPVVINIQLKKIESGARVVLNNIFFATGKYTLEEKSETELNKIIEFMQENPQVKVEISGHTDDVGSDQDNLTLSINRAKSVYSYLLESGVAQERLVYKGYGEAQPTVPNDSEANRQINRRIEFEIL
ncbi:MAG TPA: OmpA family protein [Cytophagales bacterium]|nr:OmpA family protein [Cytophagales bacterium]